MYLIKIIILPFYEEWKRASFLRLSLSNAKRCIYRGSLTRHQVKNIEGIPCISQCCFEFKQIRNHLEQRGKVHNAVAPNSKKGPPDFIFP